MSYVISHMTIRRIHREHVSEQRELPFGKLGETDSSSYTIWTGLTTTIYICNLRVNLLLPLLELNQMVVSNTHWISTCSSFPKLSLLTKSPQNFHILSPDRSVLSVKSFSGPIVTQPFKGA